MLVFDSSASSLDEELLAKAFDDVAEPVQAVPTLDRIEPVNLIHRRDVRRLLNFATEFPKALESHGLLLLSRTKQILVRCFSRAAQLLRSIDACELPTRRHRATFWR